MATIIDAGLDATPALTDAGYVVKDPLGTELDRYTLWKSIHNQWERTKDLFVLAPGASEDDPSFQTPIAITITTLIGVVVGPSSPSVTYEIRYGTDRSAAGTLVETAIVVTNTTTGVITTSLTNVTVPINGHVWLETTAQSGTVESFRATVVYKLT